MIRPIRMLLALALMAAGSAQAADLSGQWQRTYDLVLDGKVSGKTMQNTVEFTKQGDKYVGSYVEADLKRPTRVHTATMSPRRIKHHVVVLQYEDRAKAGYYSTIVALLIDDNKMVGTWYDTRGNTGDIEMARVQQQKKSYLGGTYRMGAQGLKGAMYFPAYSTAVIGTTNPPQAFKIVKGLAGSDTVSLELVDKPGNYFSVDKYNWLIRYDSPDANHREDASFKLLPGLADPAGVSFESLKHPGKFIRYKRDPKWANSPVLYVEPRSGGDFAKSATFTLQP